MSPTAEQYLRELASYQNRKLVLWQLAADGRDFCGVEFTAREMSLTGEPVEKQVEAFVEHMLHDGEVRPEHDETTNWEHLEDVYGDTATDLLQQAD